MRTSMLSILIAVLAVNSVAAEEMTLEQVLAAHYDAIGGLERIKDVQSTSTAGKMTGMMGEVPFNRLQKRPNKVRIEFTMQGMTAVMAYDSETAWMIMPFMGKADPEVIADDQAQDLLEYADMDGPLVDWQEKGHEVELVGLEEVEGTPAYRIEIVTRDGAEQTVFLDSEYFIPIKSIEQRTIQGTEVVVERTLSDYKDVGGLMMPHSVVSRRVGVEGEEQFITMEKIELDVEIDDEVFAMPPVASQESPE